MLSLSHSAISILRKKGTWLDTCSVKLIDAAYLEKNNNCWRAKVAKGYILCQLSDVDKRRRFTSRKESFYNNFLNPISKETLSPILCYSYMSLSRSTKLA